MDMKDNFNILAFIVSILVYYILGALCYSKVMFAAAWSKETKVTMGEGASAPLFYRNGVSGGQHIGRVDDPYSVEITLR